MEATPTCFASSSTDRCGTRIPGISSRRTIASVDYKQWSDSVTGEIRKRAPEAAQNQLEICFFDQNLETLLSIVGKGMPELASALGKNLMARDKLLHRAASDSGLVSSACAEMPSWEHLVATVTHLVSANRALIVSGLF